MKKHEHDLIEKQLQQNYIDHAKKLKILSADNLDEIQLKATINNDYDMMYIAELANN